MADAITVVLEVAAIGILVARLRGATFAFRNGQVTALSLVAVLALATGGMTVAIAGLGTGGHHAQASDEGQAIEEGGPADSSEGSEESSGDKVQGSADAAHEHSDGTVHVHEVGKPHVHPDRTVHVHSAEGTDPDDPAAGSQDAASPDDGHAHEGEDPH